MKHKYILIFIILVAFATRFYKLGSVPSGLYQDETAIGYNAYSLLHTGKDEYGKRFPLYFKSFGDYKLPVYIYMSAIPVKLLGMTPIAVRLPSAVFGFLSVIVFYFLVKNITKEENLATISALFLALNPWHIHYSRATFEVSIALFFYLLGTLLVYKHFQKFKGGLLLGTVCFIISLYCYNLTRLLSPLIFGLVLYYSYRLKTYSGNKKEIGMTIAASVFFLLPFFLSLFEKGGIGSSTGTLIFTSNAIKAPLLELRSYILTSSSVVARLLFNTPILILQQYIQNILNYLSVSFFFISGSTHGNHGIGNVGQFYLFELPTILIGMYYLLKSHKEWKPLIVGWTIITILVAALTRESPHATRSFFLIFPIEVISAYGFVTLFTQKKRTNILFTATLGIFILFALYNISYYFSSYFIRFPIAYAQSWRQEDKPVADYIRAHESEYSRIIFDKQAGFVYTSLLFYNGFPPDQFISTVQRAPDDTEGFSDVLSFGKYEFKDIDWSTDINQKNTLIVTSPDKYPKTISPLVTFYYPERPVVVSIKEILHGYPTQESAYVLVESNK
jgi:4-amino-4-deoxy-L-arabinose transferase-like glycosyltransferase